MFNCKVKQLNSEMPFLAYLFIYFYTFSNHITFPMLPRPIHHPTNAKIPAQRFLFESPSREYLVFII